VNTMANTTFSKRVFEIGQIVDVFIRIPGSRKEGKGFYQRGEIKTRETIGRYLVFFPDVEIGGRKGTHGWYQWTDIFYKGEGEKSDETDSVDDKNRS
jgi:hypothetical protein